MNNLILIGNGFDLAHGLKTRYIDFMLWYLNKVIKESLKKYYIYEDELIKIKYDDIIYKKEFETLQEFKEFKSKFKVKIEYKNNFFANIIEQVNDYNWVDIELEYYKELKKLCSFIESGNFDVNKVKELLKNLNYCFELIKKQLIEYLITIDITNVIKIKEIQNHFKNIFNSNDLKNLKGDEYSNLFLNFNYTSTIELYLGTGIVNPYKINYIHGNLKDESNPIIFGYGDEMDTYYEKIERLNYNEFLKNIKSFGYFKARNYKEFLRFINFDVYNVYIIGHSCGLSDRILLNSIFEHRNCNLIKIYYYEKNDLENDYTEKTQEISRHFSYNNKGKMRDLIVPLPDCLPLIKYKAN